MVKYMNSVVNIFEWCYDNKHSNDRKYIKIGMNICHKGIRLSEVLSY